VAPDEFRKTIADSYEPLVIRGVASDWPLVEAASESPQAVAGLLKRFDSGIALPLVRAPAASGGRLFYNERFDGFNFERRDMSLSAGLDAMLADNHAGQQPFMFFQCLPVAKVAPGLEATHVNPLVPDKARPNIWIGSRVRVAAHFDEARNVAIVAAGRRRFTLFPPEQIANLYVGRLDYTPAGQPISLVDPTQPDFERFPKFRQALEAAYSVELGPGDAIYIPPPWWHHVESLERLNVLVNYWWDGALAASGLPFTALVHAIQAFRHLPEAERAAWRRFVDHYAFEVDGDPSAHLPGKPGILGPMTPQMAQHIHRWLALQIGAAPKEPRR